MTKKLSSALAAAACLLTISVATQAGDLVTPVLSEQDIEARKAKLAQMAVIIEGLSVGKSKLMLKSKVTANPGGRPGRPDGDLGSPFLTIYPASLPVTARILVTTQENAVVRQYGRILGAAEPILPIGGPKNEKRADRDVYLLFVPINGPLMTEMPIWLVSLKVDDDGKVSHAVSAQSTVRITASKLGDDDPSPAVTAAFDASKVTANMSWRDHAYGFAFEMLVIYL